MSSTSEDYLNILEKSIRKMSIDKKKPHSELNTKGTSSFRIALPQIIAVTIKNMLFVEFGLTLGFPTILIPSLSGNDPEETIKMDTEAISWIGSINLICVPLGSILSGPLTQMIGRRRSMQLVTLPFFASWLIFYYSNAAWQVFLALCMTGFSGGLLEAPVLSYVAEITQPHLRGILSSTSTMSVTLGTFLQFLLGTFLPWRKVTLVNCFFPVICMMLLSLIPESPLWLLCKNKEKEAKKSLAWLRGWTQVENIQEEYTEMSLKLLETAPKEFKESTTIFEPLRFLGKREVYWPLSLVSFAFFLCHFNGSTSLTTYAIGIFSALKAPINEYYATVIMGIVQLLGCIISVSFVHLLGRRKLSFISIIGSGFCFLFIASYIYVKGIYHVYQEHPLGDSTKHWAPATFLVLSTFIYSIGIRILPWVLIGEVFPNEYRAKAAGLASAIGYVIGFIPNKIFLSLVFAMTLPGVFLFYGILCCAGVCVLYFVLPETEGSTLVEITDHFRGVSKLGNDVKKAKSQKKDVNGC